MRITRIKISQIILLVLLVFALTGCSKTTDEEEYSFDNFSVLGDLSSGDSRIDYREQIFVDDKGRVIIIQPKSYPATGKMVVWETKSTVISNDEVEEFKKSIGSSNVFDFKDAYVCKYSTKSECYIEEPVLESAEISYIKFTVDNKEKEIQLSTSNEVPMTLNEILKKLVLLRDKHKDLAWTERTSEYEDLFK